MAEVVDSIIADLQVRYQQYVEGFDRATAAHDRFTKSIPKVGASMAPIDANTAQTYADRHKKAANDIAIAEEKTTDRLKRTRKTRSDSAVQADAAEIASAKKAADAKIAEAERVAAREKRLDENARNRIIRDPSVTRGSGRNIGATVPRIGSGQAPFIDNGAAAEVVAEKEINHLLADRFDLQARAKVLSGAEKRDLQDRIGFLARLNTYKRAGLSDDQALLRAEAEILAIERARTHEAEKQALAKSARSSSSLKGVIGGATLGYAPPGGGALAGIALAGTAAAGFAAVNFASNYAKELHEVSAQLGINTRDLQVYQAAAAQAGVSSDQFRSSLGQLAANLGKAQAGDKEAGKTFRALGIDIKGVASAGELLPTLIARISGIEDPAQRANVETRLFGEAGRQLDSVLGGGIQKVTDLGLALEQAGAVLDDDDINRLNEAGKAYALIKLKLEAKLATTVAENADGVDTLASAFGNLADKALSAIGAVGRFYEANKEPIHAGIKDAIFGFTGIDYDTTAAALSQGKARHPEPIDPNANPLALGRVPGFAPIVQKGSVNSRLLGSLNAPEGKSASSLAAEAAARDKRYTDQLASAQANALRAQEELTGSIEVRANIETALVRLALKRQYDDIDADAANNKAKGADRALEDARADRLKKAAQAAADRQREVISQQKAADISVATLDHAQTQLSIDGDLLNSRLSLAETAGQRKDIELQLLKNAQAQKANDLKKQLAGMQADDPRVADVRARLNAIPADTKAQEEEIEQRNLSPGQSYIKSLPTTAEKAGEAFENAAAGGLAAFDDKLSSTVSNALHLNGIFGNILSSIIKIGLQRAIIAPIASGLFGAAGGTGGIVGSIAKSIFGGRATGGPVVPGADYLVGEKGPEVVRFGGAGKVYPNGVMPDVGPSGGGPTVVHQTINIDGRNSVTPEGFARQILDQSAQQAALAGQTAFSAGQQTLKSSARPRLPGSFG